MKNQNSHYVVRKTLELSITTGKKEDLLKQRQQLHQQSQ